MKTRVLTGSKQQIAQEVASLEGEVCEAIVFIEEPAGAAPRAGETVDDMFAEMEPYMPHVGNVDYSRDAIYSRKPGE